MDRFDVINFADLAGPNGGEWIKIGGGSFGVVFRGEYIGTEVAIKEVLPNNTYDVEKYFERECVLMKEARHPNIVQYIGLTKSPGHDGRIYIISEFVGGNLRNYIADKKKSFSWPLRVSFATDIARAVAYLHARNCLHRDLKGENLLITANNRIKVCDFGFARIAARNDDEMRRISYCGTDGYMSPEILLGIDFGLPSDVFSLGIIFCEIISRHLVDANTFKRQMPSFGLEADEVREMASSGCPKDFIQLCLDCVEVEPTKRPDMRQVIKRLRAIEHEVVQREAKAGTLTNVGSLRGSSLKAVMGSKAASTRPKAPRLPSFEGKIKVGKPAAPIKEEEGASHESSASDDSSGDEDMEEALRALENIKITGDQGQGVKTVGEAARNTIKAGSNLKISGHGNPWWSDNSSDSLPSLRPSWTRNVDVSGGSSTWGRSTAKKSESNAAGKAEPEEEYSTSVIRPSKRQEGHHGSGLASTMSKISTLGDDGTESTMTVRGQPAGAVQANTNHKVHPSDASTFAPNARENIHEDPVTQSFMTAHSSHHGHVHDDPSLAMATIASSIYEPAPLYHRFTLVKNGMRKSEGATIQNWGGSLIPPQVILANALTKCHVCNKRLGLGAFMDCDDCPYKTHAACADMAEPNCQEMQIPGNSPSVSPASVSRRGSRDESAAGGKPLGATAALNRALSSADAAIKSTTSHIRKDSGSPPLPSKDKENKTKTPPASQSRAGGLFRSKKRNSKSPSPTTNSAVRA